MRLSISPLRTLILLLITLSCPVFASGMTVPRETIEQLSALDVQKAEIRHLQAIGKLTNQESAAKQRSLDADQTKLWEPYRPMSREENTATRIAIAGLTTAKLSLLYPQWTKEEGEYRRAGEEHRRDVFHDADKNARQGAQIQKQRQDLQRQLEKGTLDQAAFKAKDSEALASIEALRNKIDPGRPRLYFDERLTQYTSHINDPPPVPAQPPQPKPVVRYEPTPPPPDFSFMYALAGAGLFIGLLWLLSKGQKEEAPTGTGVSDIHGTAAWHDLVYTADKDAVSRGVHFGRSSQPGFNHQQATAPITSKPEHHVLVTAQAGAGKGTKIILPTLLRYASSMLVVDPKGELSAVSARTRRDQLHQDIQILNPWGIFQDTYTKLGFTAATYNPLDVLDRNDPNITSLAKMLAGIIAPVTDPKNQFWEGMAAKTLTAIFLWLTHKDQLGEEKTFTRVVEIANLPKSEFQELLIKMRASKAFNGDLRNMVGQMADPSAADTYGGIMLNLQNRLDFIDNALKISTETSSVSFEKLAEGTMTVYLVIPFEYVQTHGAWLRMLIIAATQAITKARQKSPGKNRCMFLIDEFGSMGHNPTISKNLAQQRGFGIDYVLILQDFNQLKVHYNDAKDSIIGSCAYKYFSKLDDLQTAKELSEILGKKTVRTVTKGTTTGTTDKGSSQGESVSYSETGRNLLNPDEIMRLGKNTSILLHPDGAPHYLQPVDYRNLQTAYAAFAPTHPEWYWNPPLQPDPNPYYNDPPKPPSAFTSDDWLNEAYKAKQEKPEPPAADPPISSFSTSHWLNEAYKANQGKTNPPKPPTPPPFTGDEVFTADDVRLNAEREAAKARERAGAEQPPDYYNDPPPSAPRKRAKRPPKPPKPPIDTGDKVFTTKDVKENAKREAAKPIVDSPHTYGDDPFADPPDDPDEPHDPDCPNHPDNADDDPDEPDHPTFYPGLHPPEDDDPEHDDDDDDDPPDPGEGQPQTGASR